MAVQIQMRRDTASNWTSAAPTLAAGEWGLETDTLKFKIGDGTTAWASLAYSSLPSNVLPLSGGAMTGAITTNSTFDGVDIATRDAVLTSTTTTANAALPKAGGTLSGAIVGADQIISAPVLKDVGETCVANATSGATDTIDLTDGNVHNVTLTANCTFTFSNPPATGTSGSFTLFLNQDGTGSRTATWPAGNGTSTPKVIWAGGTAPTLTTTASRTDILVFTTIDGGMKWYGAVSGQDFS
jgi:hypothetical protein